MLNVRGNIWTKTSNNTHVRQSVMRHHTVRCTHLECTCVFEVLKVDLLPGTHVWWLRSRSSFAGVFGTEGPSREQQSMWALSKRFWSWTTGIIARQFWCVTGSSKHVTCGSPTLSVTNTVSPWQTSATWTIGCIPIHSRFLCIVNKYSYPMIRQDADGRLCSAQTSGADVCQYTLHNPRPALLLWGTTMTSGDYNQQYLKRNRTGDLLTLAEATSHREQTQRHQRHKKTNHIRAFYAETCNHFHKNVCHLLWTL